MKNTKAHKNTSLSERLLILLQGLENNNPDPPNLAQIADPNFLITTNLIYQTAEN